MAFSVFTFKSYLKYLVQFKESCGNEKKIKIITLSDLESFQWAKIAVVSENLQTAFIKYYKE